EGDAVMRRRDLRSLKRAGVSPDGRSGEIRTDPTVASVPRRNGTVDLQVHKMARILVLGGGFAGLWAAVGAARKLDEVGSLPGDVEILVVDRNPYHSIRVRNYEIDLSAVIIPLADVLD